MTGRIGIITSAIAGTTKTVNNPGGQIFAIPRRRASQCRWQGDASRVEIPQADFPSAREVVISTEVTDANNQTLTSTATTTVHPASVYVGISRNDSLIRAGDTVPLKHRRR